jgi:hypothetical protein
MRRSVVIACVLVALAAGMAAAHITPPVVLVSDRDAMVGILSSARRVFVREVRLTPSERQAVQRASGWTPDEDFYRFYLGRDAGNRLVSAGIFVTDFTIHGPVRVAVGLAPDGKVTGVTVVEVSEETYTWIKPLIDADMGRDFVGQGIGAAFKPGERVTKVSRDAMQLFYAQVIGGLVKRATLLFDVGVVKHGAAG